MKVLSVYRCVVISYVGRCCREYISYLIKTLSIVAKQKVLLFTVKRICCETSRIFWWKLQTTGGDTYFTYVLSVLLHAYWLFIVHILLQIKHHLVNLTTLQNITLNAIKLFSLIFHKNVFKRYICIYEIYNYILCHKPLCLSRRHFCVNFMWLYYLKGPTGPTIMFIQQHEQLKTDFTDYSLSFLTVTIIVGFCRIFSPSKLLTNILPTHTSIILFTVDIMQTDIWRPWLTTGVSRIDIF
jgi:hypothetical protein